AAPRLFEPVLAADGETFLFGGSPGDGLYAVMSARVSVASGKLLEPARAVTKPGTAIPRHLALSKDGRTLAWSALTTTSRILSLPVDAGGSPTAPAHPLTPPAFREARPVFSPDGRRIAFDRRLSGENENVWVMDRDGGNPVQVTHEKESVYSRDWFP